MKKDKSLPSDKPVRIGGQALIEGIMMRGKNSAALAVRQKDGGIYTEKWDLITGRWYQKFLFIRGVYNFFTQMKDGYKYMMISAEKCGLFEEENTTSDKDNNSVVSKKESSVLNFAMQLGAVLGVVLAFIIFFFLPTRLFTLLEYIISVDISPFRSLIERIIKIILFVGYIAATNFSKDIRRTYEYHGAEHKTIAAIEAVTNGKSKDSIIPSNVKKYTRFHPRCGTSFIFLSLVVSVIFYSFVPINSEVFIQNFGVNSLVADIMRVFCMLVLLPFIVGITYEIIRLAGSYSDNIFFKILSAPGLLIQRLTTREPDEKQIEIAIEAVRQIDGLPKK